jgi:signal transduction histidine kinase/CHASE2 domain-containing sensor protein
MSHKPSLPSGTSWTQTLRLIPEVRKGARWRARQLRQGLWVGVIAASLILFVWVSGAFTTVRLRAQDAAYIPMPTSEQITIVALDDASLEAYGRSPTEWSRTVYAELIDRLAAAGARVIAFDILFAEPTADDAAVVAAMERAQTSDARVRIVMPRVGVRRADDVAFNDSLGQAVEYDQVLSPVPIFANQADVLGYANVYSDIDHAVRRYVSLVRTRGATPSATTTDVSFSVATYLSYLRISPAAYAQLIQSGAGTLQLTPDRTLRVDSAGLWMPYYFGTPSADVNGTFPVISLRDVVTGNADPALFADRIVLVGVLNSTGFNDLHPVPSRAGRSMSGIEIHANAIESLLQEMLPVEQTPAGQVFTIIVLAIAMGLVYSLMRWYVILISAPILLLVWIIAAFVWFQAQLELLNLFHSSLAVIVPAVIALGVNVAREIERRQRGEWLLQQVSALYAETRRQKVMLEALIAGSPVGILVVNDNSMITRGNAAVETALGVDLRQTTQTTQTDARAIDDLFNQLKIAPETRAELKRHLAGRTPFRLDIDHAGKHYLIDGAPLEGIPLDTTSIKGDDGADAGNGGWMLLLNDVSTLHELSNLKTRMIRMASHDLKNPLTIIFVIGKLLLENETIDTTDARTRDFIERMLDSAQRMNEIIDHILKMERAKAGEIERDPVHIGEIVDAVVRQHRPQIDAKQQTISVDIAGRLPFVSGDIQQLTQAIANLVGNASKYTPDGGSIRVRVSIIGDGASDGAANGRGGVHLEVSDTGFGIPKEAQGRLFQEFYRVSTPDTVNIPGTGLGLSLVKSVIDAHGGRISFISDAGKGSTFYIDLPAMEDERHRPHA